MAQVTITHFQEQTLLELAKWKSATEKVTAYIVYGRRKPEPGDVTVRTLTVKKEGSTSDAYTEVHVEIAESGWPKTKNGDDLTVEEATTYFSDMAIKIRDGIADSINKPASLNVWVTPYRATGWAAFKT